MDNRIVRNRRLGLVLIVTAAIVTTVLLVPGVVLGLTTYFASGKDPAVYKVGEWVLFNASINLAAEEVANIQSVTLEVNPAPGKPGSESFLVELPLAEGSFDLTNRLPADMRGDPTHGRDSKLEVDVTWTDIAGPNGGGYGYKGLSGEARIDFTIRWLPPILRLAPPPPPPPLNFPEPAFPNPGAAGEGAATLETEFQFTVPVTPEAPAGAEVLGLAFDRKNWYLLILMDNPTTLNGGNDTILVVEPWSGFIFDIIDTGVTDAQDVAWLTDPNDPGYAFPPEKNPSMEGSIWITYGPTSNQKLKNLTDGVTVYNVTDALPIAGLGAIPYKDPLGNQQLIPSYLQTDPTLGIPVKLIPVPAGPPGLNLNIPAGPTGGGYNDVVMNDSVIGPPTVLGGYGGTLGEFDVPSGAFLGSLDVVNITPEPDVPLTNIVGLAMSQDGEMWVADYASQGTIYMASLGPGAGAGNFARAITNDPAGDIYLLLDDAGAGGEDRIVGVDDTGTTTGVAFDGPSGGLEGLAFLNGYLYTIDNWSGPRQLYKLDPATGAIQAGYPKNLPDFVDEIGGLTVDSSGTKLVAIEQWNDNLYHVDPATGAVTFSTTLNVPSGSPVPQPFGLDALTSVTGCPAPTCPFLLGAKFTGFFFIDEGTYDIVDFQPVDTFPPFGITGLTQRGDLILFTDDSQQVFKAGVPGAPPPENTSAGDYEAFFAVIHNTTTDTQSVLFTVERVDELTVTITDPQDGDSFTSTPITVQGTVNDPTVKTVTLGIDLPTTTLLGPADFEADDEGFDLTGLWHRTNNFIDPGNPRAIDDWSLAYTQDPINDGPQYNFDTGTPNSGTATSDTFDVGDNTKLTFWTWYDTEGGNMYDQKLIRIQAYDSAGDPSGPPQTIAQIIDFPPLDPITGMPLFGAAPGTIFQDPGLAPWDLVFIPMAMFDPFGGPVFTQVALPLNDFVGQTVAVQFYFDTVDAFVNEQEGWFVDEITVEGAGAAKGQTLDVVNLQFSGQFDLAPGDNKIKVSAIRDAYTPVLTDADIVTVSLDLSKPILKLLLTEDINGNGTLDTDVDLDLDGDGETDVTIDEDINGDGALTVLPTMTNNAVQTVFGVFLEDNPALLTVKVNNKLVLSLKAADLDPDNPVFSTTVNLKSGTNTIAINMKDAGGLEPDPSDPLNNLSTTVILDQTGPTLTPLATIYPFTAISGTQGDPVVYQVTATDAETDVKKVEIFASAGSSMFEAAEVPEVLRDQWGTTGNYIFPTIIPSTAPPGALSLTVKATDLAGNTTTGTVTATVEASMKAWNTCLQSGGNLISLPIQPTNGDIATLLSQIVANIDPAFTGTPARLSDVVESISYWTGGTSGIGSFKVYTPGPAYDDLSELEEGKAFWIFTKPEAFLEAAPLPGFTTASYSCVNMTTLGQFLTPGDVPPVFPVVKGWNMVGRHSEDDATVEQFLAGVTFPSRVWTSLLTFKNAIEFDYENASDLPMDKRLAGKFGVFESRFNLTDPVQRGEGFWLFVVADGQITP